MRVKHIAHVELFVENADEIANAYTKTFGLQRIAEARPETGMAGRFSVALASDEARVLITSATSDDGPVAAYVRHHGDSVRDVAFEVEDVRAAYAELMARGATSIEPPATWDGGGGACVRATVGGFGDVVHSLIQREGGPGALLPFYRPVNGPKAPRSSYTCIDHVAMCVETGTLDATTAFYERVFGFVNSYEQYIETDISGMNARVVEDESGTVKFPMQEPLPNSHGPIAEFIDKHRGAGVYHVGLQTEDILPELRTLRDRGGHVLETPRAYYEALPRRVGALAEDIVDLRDLHVLVDRDQYGYLLQVFTRSLHPRKTFFIEVIQRKAARSFGNANVRALFDAVEREAMA
jgi:4-hydroxyphenylpyruvate dioxygenase